ncbi:hypothetical protein Acr_11g0002000 [Actinidia rufa]|uniref:Reverse transcriptase domain-containing protein n=1 Tax=Actinidia rufa TaxID=165716 RepID=A0A7J0FAZ7_9ERIC|nr:hypothetical protein Acr_11g0002000 [Actinidia rufa]
MHIFPDLFCLLQWVICTGSSRAKEAYDKATPSPIPFCYMPGIPFRALGSLRDNPDFNFHPKCGGLKITHLAFADDLVLFSRGDPTSVSLLMENLNHFRDCSGLQISISKSCFHSAGIEIADMEEIQRITGFSQGSFPFRYLGIPIANSRLTISQFSPLLDKISGYISVWVGANLSYAGKTELVKSVLQDQRMRLLTTSSLDAEWEARFGPKSKPGWGITRAMQTIKASVKWLIKEAKGTGLQAKIKKISLACTVYHLWEARNQRIFEGKIKSPEALIRGIQIQVHRCINSLSEAQ